MKNRREPVEKRARRRLPKGAAAFLTLLLCLGLISARAETAPMDGYYDLQQVVSAEEGETAVLLIDHSYYSGDQIYKGSTGRPLNGACAMHCAAVLISNMRGEVVTGQQVAKANNRDIRDERRWTPFVSWGKVASAFGIGVSTEDLARYGNYLKNHRVGTAQRRAMKMARIVEIFRERAGSAGLAIHFNSSGRLNGSGNHRHAVVLVGYIERGGEIVDLLINDSSVAAPAGACVRMSRSSLPEPIIGAKKYKKAVEAGEDIAMLLMDYAVSCRWITDNNEGSQLETAADR